MKDLNGVWRITSDLKSDKDVKWLEIQIPNDTYNALLKLNKIKNPYYSTNLEKLDYIEKSDWWFKKVFKLNDKYRNKKLILVFEGLDTYAEIYLNNQLIAQNENMFLPLKIDITDKVKFKSSNILLIKFISIYKKYQSTDKIAYMRKNTRKCQMSFGWDFAPKILTAGIWKDVYIEDLKDICLENFLVESKIESKNKALLGFKFNITNFLNSKVRIIININGRCKNSFFNGSYNFSLKPGNNKINLNTGINNPKLWFPHNIGEPNLYKIKINIFHKNNNVITRQLHYGIRDIKLVIENKGENYFYFKINNIPIFSKGANWVPVDSMISNISSEKYSKLLNLARDGNINMLRVWGGVEFMKMKHSTNYVTEWELWCGRILCLPVSNIRKIKNFSSW